MVSANTTFEVIPNESHFHILTNFDFDKYNNDLRKKDTQHDNLTAAHLANEVLTSHADMALASHYGGDLYTTPLSSKIVRLRYSELLRRSGIHRTELSQFIDIVMPDCPSVSEVINSGLRTFDEFLDLLDKSDRFRKWLDEVHPDEKLVKAYFDEVTATGWLATLPAKTIRYMLGEAVGKVAPMIGAAYSVIDALLLEKLLRGWRPNHFVNKRLIPFVGAQLS